MKKIFSLSLIIACLQFVNIVHAQTGNTSLLRHIVIITFKQDVSADSIKVLDDAYKSLAESPMVKDFEMGVNISPRDTGVIKHVYVTSFASQADMQSYRKMPLYAQLFKISLPVSEDVTVADYWANK